MNGERERNEDVVDDDSVPSGTRNRPSGKRVSNVSQRRAARLDATSSAGGTATLTRPDEEDEQPAKRRRSDGTKRPNPIARLITFFGEVVGELRKVIWPSRKQMISYTIVVLLFLAAMVALIGGVNLGFIKIVSWLFG